MISLPLPAELPPAFASGVQTLLLMRQVIVQLLAVIQQQTARIAALEARLSQNSLCVRPAFPEGMNGIDLGQVFRRFGVHTRSLQKLSLAYYTHNLRRVAVRLHI